MAPPKQTEMLAQILEELKALNNKVDGIDNKLEALTTKVNGIREDVDKNTAAIATLRAEFDAHKEKSSAEVLKLKVSMNKREQQLRSCTVRIFNMPHVYGESVDNFSALTKHVYDRLISPALTAAVAAGDLPRVPPQQQAIEACFRAFSPTEPNPDTPPAPVICRLSSRFIKYCLMKNRRAATTPSEAERSARARRLVIVEDLTPPTHSLLKALQADDRVEKVWSVNGQVHYTLVDQAGVKKVKNVFDTVDSILEK